MSDDKVLTKEIVEEMMGDIDGYGYVYQFTDYSDVPTLDLSDFTRIEDGVGEFLSEYEGREFCQFCESHVQSGLLNLLLDLSGVTALSPEEAESLSRHKGDLGLNGLTEMSTGIAMRLCEHKGGVLYLEGLKVLSQGAAMFLRRHCDLRVTLELLPTSIREILTPEVDSSTDEITSLVTAVWSTLSSKHRNEVKRILCFDKATILTETVVDELLAENNLKSTGEFTKIVDAAAQRLAKHEGEIDLSGLTELSDGVAESLSKHEGGLGLYGLTSLSDAAAESLSKYGGFLNLTLDNLPASAAQILRDAGHERFRRAMGVHDD